MTTLIQVVVDGRVYQLDIDQERREAIEAARRYFASERREPEPRELSQFVYNWLEAAKVYGPRRADLSRPPAETQQELF